LTKLVERAVNVDLASAGFASSVKLFPLAL